MDKKKKQGGVLEHIVDGVAQGLGEVVNGVMGAAVKVGEVAIDGVCAAGKIIVEGIAEGAGGC